MAESMNEVQNTIRLTRFLIHRNPTMMSFNLDDVFSQSVQNVSNESGFAGVSAFQMFGYMAQSGYGLVWGLEGKEFGRREIGTGNMRMQCPPNVFLNRRMLRKDLRASTQILVREPTIPHIRRKCCNRVTE